MVLCHMKQGKDPINKGNTKVHNSAGYLGCIFSMAYLIHYNGYVPDK